MTGDESRLDVRGGINGVEARYLDMEDLVDHTRDVADRLLGFAWEDKFKAVDGDIVASAILSPLTAARAEAAIVLASGSLTQHALRLEVIAIGTQMNRTLSGLTDAAIETALDGITYGIGFSAPLMPAPMMGLGLLSAVTGNESLMGEAYDGLRDNLEHNPAWFLGLGLLGMTGGRVGGMSRDLFGGLYGPRRHGRAQYEAGSGIDLPVPRTVGDLTRAVDTTSGKVGRFTVQEVVGADGVSRWIVHLPGTDFDDPESVRDFTSNLQLMDGGRTAYGDAVSDALADAGVGRTEPVLLVGHSQGGMQAMALADDPDFDYRVKGVLTLGSPVAGVDLGERVSVLNLENSDDPVPMTDGGDNAAGPWQVTVSSDVDDTALIENHSLEDSYLRISERVDLSEDPSIRDVVRRWQMEGFLVGTGSSTSRTYTAQFADGE